MKLIITKKIISKKIREIMKQFAEIKYAGLQILCYKNIDENLFRKVDFALEKTSKSFKVEVWDNITPKCLEYRFITDDEKEYCVYCILLKISKEEAMSPDLGHMSQLEFEALFKICDLHFFISKTEIKVTVVVDGGFKDRNFNITKDHDDLVKAFAKIY